MIFLRPPALESPYNAPRSAFGGPTRRPPRGPAELRPHEAPRRRRHAPRGHQDGSGHPPPPGGAGRARRRVRDRAAPRDARPGLRSLRPHARHRPRPDAPRPDDQRARRARPRWPRRRARARDAGLAPGAGRHDDGDGRGARGLPPERARGARRGGAAHGRLPAPFPRGDEPPRRRPRFGCELRSHAPSRAGARGRGRPGGEDLPDRQHRRRRARGDREPRGRRAGGRPGAHHRAPARELRRAARARGPRDRPPRRAFPGDAVRPRHPPQPQRQERRPPERVLPQRDARASRSITWRSCA